MTLESSSEAGGYRWSWRLQVRLEAKRESGGYIYIYRIKYIYSFSVSIFVKLYVILCVMVFSSRYLTQYLSPGIR